MKCDPKEWLENFIKRVQDQSAQGMWKISSEEYFTECSRTASTSTKCGRVRILLSSIWTRLLENRINILFHQHFCQDLFAEILCKTFDSFVDDLAWEVESHVVWKPAWHSIASEENDKNEIIIKWLLKFKYSLEKLPGSVLRKIFVLWFGSR